MQPLSFWPLHSRRDLVGVFTDIDDTLTTGGAITPDALQALSDLKAAGLIIIPITGRPIGWCEPFIAGAAPWPVDAMVAENGGVAFSRKKGLQPSLDARKPLSKLYQQDANSRTHNQARMQQIAAQVMAEIPGVALSRDGDGRETDLAFDYNEFVRLSPEIVQQVVAMLQHTGMHTTVSSIHIHGCFGDFTKWTGACWIVRELFSRDLTQELDRWVFVGDSGNDQAMFEHFIHSAGVANITHHTAQMQHLPRYITSRSRGAGFVEVAEAILEGYVR
ncbi:MAG: HAD family phosphatase [Rhodoferax sp.]|nr:HAD family phosphatase [Rhodoferax sp.]